MARRRTNKLKKMTRTIKKKMRRNTRRGRGSEISPGGTVKWKLDDNDKIIIYLMRHGLPYEIAKRIVFEDTRNLPDNLKSAIKERALISESKYSDENAIYPSERLRKQMNEKSFRPGDNSWRQTGIYRNPEDWWPNQTLPPIVFIPTSHGPMIPRRQPARGWNYTEEWWNSPN